MFVLDFVTAVSAAEEEGEGERGRGGDALQWKPWARDSRTPLLAALMRQAAAAAPEISRLPDASLTFLAFLV